MPINRGRSNDPFARVNKTPLEDIRLSWKAKGLMAYMLSKSDDWVFYLRELEKHAPDGKDSLRSAVLELERYGYLVREQSRSEGGTFGESNWHLYADPTDEGLSDEGLTDSGKSDDGKPATTKNDSTKNDLTKNDLNTEVEIFPRKVNHPDELPDDLSNKKINEPLYLDLCQEIYNYMRLSNWTQCRQLSKETIGHLRGLATAYKSYRTAAKAFAAALEGMRTNPWYKDKKLSIQNLGTRNKFYDEAEKSLINMQQDNRDAIREGIRNARARQDA